MNGIELFLLGRTLMKIGEEAIPTDGVGQYSTSHRSVLIVASDIRAYPGSSIGEIAERTGFPQSKVSACVARLREAGAIDTEADPTDRRRLLVRPAARISARVDRVRSAPIEGALAAALGTDDPQRIAEVAAALDTLARHLTPQALARLRTTSNSLPSTG
ncbi:MarR family winged helix-turn-helix transcriptional regulator [Micromonospora pisi]|uniref:MarR family winged helix-turn-helix transcriptional regulator n=1 Tax=Micromonospora pisi TaxID=589240 RepID=UPI001B884B7D|nr:helix-turn-helix domain-containing protein [Micromonospora pisi]